MSNSYFWSIDWTPSGASTPSQSEPGSDGNKQELHITQSSSITGASPLNCLVCHIQDTGCMEGVVLPHCRDAVVYSTATVQLGSRHWLSTAEILFISKWSIIILTIYILNVPIQFFLTIFYLFIIIIIMIYLLIIIKYQVFLSNTNNLPTVI